MEKNTHQPNKNRERVDPQYLHDLAYKTILDLETPMGINASGKEERYAAFFGRDSMITCLKLLRVHKKNPDQTYLRIIKNTIKTAIRLQGKDLNISSGEKPGKIIHEYREKGYYHLTNRPQPWYVYPDKTLRNYDTTDSTLLFLILTAEYYNFTNDDNFIKENLQSIYKAFSWAEKYGFKGGNKLFIEYQLHRPPHMGGLVNQGWMDSLDSILIQGKPPEEPITLVETQGYYFKALRLWSEILESIDEEKARELSELARKLKEEFNKFFLMRSDDLNYFCYALFDQKAHILEVRSNPGHCLWSSVKSNGKWESIIDEKFIGDVVDRIMKDDLFVQSAGIRTLSSTSQFFNPFSYHNGSIWPFDNGLIAEGFENFGYMEESKKIKNGILSAVNFFGSVIELFCSDLEGNLYEYAEGSTRHGTRKQAWTAATVLDFVTDDV